MGRLVIIALVLLAGCAPEPPKHISSHVDRDTVREWAEQIEETNPDLQIVTITPDSPSMGLTISDFSYVLVQRDWDSIAIGHVIVFYNESYQRIIHQVIDRDGDYIKTQGIANSRADKGWVIEERYIGTMVAQFYANEAMEVL